MATDQPPKGEGSATPSSSQDQHQNGANVGASQLASSTSLLKRILKTTNNWRHGASSQQQLENNVHHNSEGTGLVQASDDQSPNQSIQVTGPGHNQPEQHNLTTELQTRMKKSSSLGKFKFGSSRNDSTQQPTEIIASSSTSPTRTTPKKQSTGNTLVKDLPESSQQTQSGIRQNNGDMFGEAIEKLPARKKQQPVGAVEFSKGAMTSTTHSFPTPSPLSSPSKFPSHQKTSIRSFTFMESFSDSSDHTLNSANNNSNSSGSSKKGSHQQAAVETNVLFSEFQTFQSNMEKRYCKILEQPTICKALNFEVLGPRHILNNKLIAPIITNSPQDETKHEATESILGAPNPYLFDKKIVDEFKWRRRRMGLPDDFKSNASFQPNVPTVDIVCEDGATLSCYLEVIGTNNMDHSPTATVRSDVFDKSPSTKSNESKKTILFFHDGCEEAFEYYSNPTLRKFKDFILSMGLQLFIFEYRGFGYSTCAKGEDERCSLHRFLQTDFKLVHHLFTTKLKIPMTDVIVYGKGVLGSTCAIHYASNFPNICGLCLESPCVDVLRLVLGNLNEEHLSKLNYHTNSQWNVATAEDENILFEFTTFDFGMGKYYSMPTENKSGMVRKKNPRLNSSKSTITCRFGDETHYNLKELKTCIQHHFATIDKLQHFNSKLLILYQQGNELTPFCDIENVFKSIKTVEKNMYLLSESILTETSTALDDPFYVFERKFPMCSKAIHSFVQSVGHVLPDNYGQFLDKLLELYLKQQYQQQNNIEVDDIYGTQVLTEDMSELATSTYVDTFASFGGRRRRNPHLPSCGGCGHCRACIDQSMLEEEEGSSNGTDMDEFSEIDIS